MPARGRGWERPTPARVWRGRNPFFTGWYSISDLAVQMSIHLCVFFGVRGTAILCPFPGRAQDPPLRSAFYFVNPENMQPIYHPAHRAAKPQACPPAPPGGAMSSTLHSVALGRLQIPNKICAFILFLYVTRRIVRFCRRILTAGKTCGKILQSAIG